MPRTARSIEAGMVDHVLNRGNGRLRLFQKEGDYDALAWRGLAWRGQTEFQVNLKLGLTPRSRETRSDPEVPTPRSPKLGLTPRSPLGASSSNPGASPGVIPSPCENDSTRSGRHLGIKT